MLSSIHEHKDEASLHRANNVESSLVKARLVEIVTNHTGKKLMIVALAAPDLPKRENCCFILDLVTCIMRPIQCAFCPKHFQRKNMLLRHASIHTDPKPYGCMFCG